jgi:hypothetical protein
MSAPDGQPSGYRPVAGLNRPLDQETQATVVCRNGIEHTVRIGLFVGQTTRCRVSAKSGVVFIASCFV